MRCNDWCWQTHLIISLHKLGLVLVLSELWLLFNRHSIHALVPFMAIIESLEIIIAAAVAALGGNWVETIDKSEFLMSTHSIHYRKVTGSVAWLRWIFNTFYVLILNILDTLLALLQIFCIELILLVGEVHSFDASTHNLLIFLVHHEPGNVRVMVRPLVRALCNLYNFTPGFESLLLLILFEGYQIGVLD